MEDLPRVILKDIDGHVHLRNLSLTTVTSEEAALNALFLGDTNRSPPPFHPTPREAAPSFMPFYPCCFRHFLFPLFFFLLSAG
jgi:hypothetical protein